MDGHILCFVLTVVVSRQHISTKRTQSSMGGLVIGKPVAVVSKVENSVAFLHLQYQNFFLQRPKSKFGLSLLGTHIGNWNLDQYFQSTDFLVDLMSYMLRCTMLLVKATTRTAFFTLQWCRNTRVVDVARFSPLKIPLTMIYSKIRRPLQTVESPFLKNIDNGSFYPQIGLSVGQIFLYQ